MASKKKIKASDESQQESPEVSGWAIFSPPVIRKFTSEVKAEFKKIVWPDRKVTLGLTGFVFVFVIFMALYLGSVDLILGTLVASILR